MMNGTIDSLMESYPRQMSIQLTFIKPLRPWSAEHVFIVDRSNDRNGKQVAHSAEEREMYKKFRQEVEYILNKFVGEFDCDFKFNKIHSPNNYTLRMDINFVFHKMTFNRFELFLKKYQQLATEYYSNQLIIELSLDLITILNKRLFSLSHQYYCFDVHNISLGSLVNFTNFIDHFSIRHNTSQFECKWNFYKNSITVQFQFHKKQLFKLVIPFSSIKCLLLEYGRQYTNIYIDLLYIPLLFATTLDNKQVLQMAKGLNSDLKWKRVANFNQSIAPRRPFAPVDDDQVDIEVDPCLLGMAKTICLQFTSDMQILDKILCMGHICKELNKKFFFYVSNIRVRNASVTFQQVKNMLDERRLPFPVYYACLALFSNSYKIIDSLDEEKQLVSFLDLVQKKSLLNIALIERSLFFVKSQCKHSCIVNAYYELVKLLQNRHPEFDTTYLPVHDDYVLVRRAIQSPTHLEFCQPIPLLRSRFSNIANMDYALRLCLIDDSNNKLNNCSTKDENFIKESIQSALLNGVLIGDRRYELLGSSSSQMRENGLIMYATDDQGRSAQFIRNSAGDLSEFKRNAPKYVARLGLLFSQAIFMFPIEKKNIEILSIGDLYGEVKPNFQKRINFKKERYIFSDGVGIISRSVVELFMASLNHRFVNYFPAAFQIRLGGSKGMLVVHDLESKKIAIRKSMQKYPSKDTTLGILKFAAPRPVFLNRPLINILDQLQVHPKVFYEFFKASTDVVAKALLSEDYSLQLLKTYSKAFFPYERLHQFGVKLLQEPFFRNLINYLIHYRLNELKNKARIRVPLSHGRIAFGVVDEYQKLEYGEVFFQYSKLSVDGSTIIGTEILKGEVMVTKFPCLQPGDVRKLKAVDVEQLHSIKDCIVFPSKGPRPHPDELGGSDLDGDEYALFWDTGLIFPVDNCKSMTFPYGFTQIQEEDITMEDIVKFYCDFLVCNNIGKVANCHLIYSDLHPSGIMSNECKYLAIQYSHAVDYQKTGYIEHLPPKIKPSLQPDFMEKFSMNKCYLSTKILGQFYRHCSLIDKTIDLCNYGKVFYPQPGDFSSANPRFILPGWRKYYSQAEDAFIEYKLRLVSIMEQMDVENEIVLLSDVYELKADSSNLLIQHLLKHFGEKFEKQCADMKSEHEQMLCASAWYAICYEMDVSFNQVRLFGLPWTIVPQMCKLSQYTAMFNIEKFPKPEIDHLEEEEKLINQLTQSNQQMQQEHQNLVISITLQLILSWIYKIKYHIYGIHDRQSIRFTSVNIDECGNIQAKEKIISEREFLQNFILKNLKEICENRLSQSKWTTVSILFNEFMMYMFQICNNCNERIMDGVLEELILLRYAVFALSFVDKLKYTHDLTFYQSIRMDEIGRLLSQYVWNMDLDKKSDCENDDDDWFANDLDDIKEDADSVLSTDGAGDDGSIIITNNRCKGVSIDGNTHNTDNVYQTWLNTHFEMYYSNSATMNKENRSFHLVQTDEISLDEFDATFEQKIQYLTGVETFKVTGICQNNLFLFADEYGSSMTESKPQSELIRTYQVTSYGLDHCNLILRLLLGHTHFYNRIFKKFSVDNYLS